MKTKDLEQHNNLIFSKGVDESENQRETAGATNSEPEGGDGNQPAPERHRSYQEGWPSTTFSEIQKENETGIKMRTTTYLKK